MRRKRPCGVGKQPLKELFLSDFFCDQQVLVPVLRVKTHCMLARQAGNQFEAADAAIQDQLRAGSVESCFRTRPG